MILFMVGDFKTDTGPGIANKIIRNGLNNKRNVIYSNSNSKLFRIIELVIKIIICDCVCFCSYSKINLIGIKIAKYLRKKTFYIMHGYCTYECEINNRKMIKEQLKEIKDFEQFIFEHSDKVFCVSKKFMEFMKNNEPKYADKFDYNYNGIDIKGIEKNVCKNNKKLNQIVSLGGGIPQKNNLAVCRAINKLNKEKNMKLKYIVVGSPGEDKEEICSYDFVTYYDRLTNKEVINILGESQIYIQNSFLETFGVSIIEALLADCNLLISNNIGVTDVLKTIRDSDLIYDITDINEISKKIEYVVECNNVQRLKEGLDTDIIDYITASETLYKKILKYCK